MPTPAGFHRLASMLHAIALGTALLTAIVPPAMVWFEGYRGEKRNLAFRSQVIAGQIAKLANIQGEMWQYSAHRLPELIAIGDPEGVYRAVVYSADKTTTYYTAGQAQSNPSLSTYQPIVVRGETVGFLALFRSAEKILDALVVTALLSTSLGLLVYAVFSRWPFKMLMETTQALEVMRSELAEEARLKRQEAERANEATKIKSNFLANMSHEMRTPLNAIIGFSEVMRSQLFGPLNKVYASYAEDILKSGNHLLELVNSLLDLAKIEQNKLEIREDAFQIKGLVGDAVSLLREQAKHKNQIVGTWYDPDLPEVVVSDKGLIFQVLVNLLSNAIKFTGNNGRIFVRAVFSDGLLELVVKDTGVGMAAEELELALEPFGQLNNPLTANVSGTGLGLPIVASYVEHLGGTFDFQSTPNVGTTVTVRFPVTVSDQEILDLQSAS